MKTSKLKCCIILLTILVFCIKLHAQNDEKMFISGEGFKINLPEPTSPMKKIFFDDGKLNGNLKVFYWNKPGEYFYQIFSYKFDTDKKSLSAAEINHLLESLKNDLISEPKEMGYMFAEKDYIFNGNKGKQLTVILPKGKSIARYFTVGKRAFLLNTAFDNSQDEDQIIKILDSFALLDSKSLVAAKLKDAEPSPLPQKSDGVRINTDAQDENLKGKVKSVIEYTQTEGKGKQEIYSELYFDENGNKIREVSYEEGYPSSITAWGYIDKNRVSKTNIIEFDEDQRPPSKNMIITASPMINSDAPRDERYSTKYQYKYDGGKLIEDATFLNNGDLSSRKIYKYSENLKETFFYSGTGDLWSHTYEILDENGNVKESYYIGDDGKKEDVTFNSYELDDKGNWTVQKTFEETKIKGKPVKKILWITYRTITYYPVK